MKAIVVGPDAGELGDALDAEGVEVTRIEGIGTRPADAGAPRLGASDARG